MPVEQWRITEVREVISPGEDAWLITYEPVDGDPDAGFVSYVPKEAVEVRAAEYGLTSADEALDVILHAPLLAHAHAAGELDMPSPALVDVATARAQVAEQLATCKAKYGVVTTAAAGTGRAATTADPLQVIRDRTRIDPVRSATIRMEMDRYRLAHEADTENGGGR
ncbi:hypothetical protein [Nonomuraea cavernae]|uniref:Uncharacterized protein n=1 Tax=Nonomuraea cavernae TaxID=2045107 RepID=A0A917YPQ9_9ACTN|nr:hypothetical protein [Nonomuraea cavernae]MCA2184629.1 hypothetical protein [Nonomuraea cavernae]GGO63221.1 hypothetical protein GCM10012289_09700 [Nonomuraea cavernae]